MENAPPMIPLVLDLDKQAEGQVVGARDEAQKIRQDAQNKREAESAAARAETQTQVRRVEDDAHGIRENEVNKLRSTQAGQLAAVKQLSPEKLAAGVELVLQRLRETKA